jgi:hypothetical protein
MEIIKKGINMFNKKRSKRDKINVNKSSNFFEMDKDIFEDKSEYHKIKNKYNKIKKKKNINIKRFKSFLTFKKKIKNKICALHKKINNKKLNKIKDKNKQLIEKLNRIKKTKYNKLFLMKNKRKTIKKSFLFYLNKKDRRDNMKKRKYLLLKKSINKNITKVRNIIISTIFYDYKGIKNSFSVISNKMIKNNLSLNNKNYIRENEKKLIKKSNINLLKRYINNKNVLINEHNVLYVQKLLLYINALKFKLKQLLVGNKKKFSLIYHKNKKERKYVINKNRKQFHGKNTLKINKSSYHFLKNDILNTSYVNINRNKIKNNNNLFYILNVKNESILLNNKNIYKLLLLNSNNNKNTSLILLFDILINYIIKKRYQLYNKQIRYINKLKNVYKKNNILILNKVSLLKNYYRLFKSNGLDNSNGKLLFLLKRWRKRTKKNLLFGPKYIKKYAKQFNRKWKRKLSPIDRKKYNYFFYKLHNRFITLNKYNKQINFYKKKLNIFNKLNKTVMINIFNLLKLKTILINNISVDTLNKINNLFLSFINNKKIDKKWKINKKMIFEKWYGKKFSKKKNKIKMMNLNKSNKDSLIDYFNYFTESIDLSTNKKQLDEIKKNLIKIFFYLLKLDNKNKFLKNNKESKIWIKNKIKYYFIERRNILKSIFLRKKINTLTYAEYVMYKATCLQLKKQLFSDIIIYFENKNDSVIEIVNANKRNKELLNKINLIHNENNKYLKRKNKYYNNRRGLLNKKMLLKILGTKKIYMKSGNVDINVLQKEFNIGIKLKKIKDKKRNNIGRKIHLIVASSRFNLLLNKMIGNKNKLNILFYETNANARYIVSDENYKIIHSRSVGSLGLDKEDMKMKKWRKKLGEHLTYWVYKTLKNKEKKYDYINLRTLGKRRIIKPLFYKLRTFLRRRTFRLKRALKKKYNYWKKKMNYHYKQDKKTNNYDLNKKFMKNKY